MITMNIPANCNHPTSSPWMALIVTVVTGTMFINSMPFSGFKILLPSFHANTASTPAITEHNQ
jgi:hypothetical protein